MDNQQFYNLESKQSQVFLSGILGDGSLHLRKDSKNYNYHTNCIHKEYLEFKQSETPDFSSRIYFTEKNGYSQKPIYNMIYNSSDFFTHLHKLSIEEIISNLNSFGIALWFCDDGSLHKSKQFYNLNTHSFNKEIQEEVFIPFLEKFGIFSKLTNEVKKDGRSFWYLRVGKYDGSNIISEMIEDLNVKCFEYKVWNSETIQKWSKLQEKLKREDIIETTPAMLGSMFRYCKI